MWRVKFIQITLVEHGFNQISFISFNSIIATNIRGEVKGMFREMLDMVPDMIEVIIHNQSISTVDGNWR